MNYHTKVSKNTHFLFVVVGLGIQKQKILISKTPKNSIKPISNVVKYVKNMYKYV